eukprot:3537319-Pyramimonas_sp.AAC.1
MRLAASGIQRIRSSWTLVYNRRRAALKVYPDFDAACIDRIKQHQVLSRVPDDDGDDDDEDDDNALASSAKKTAPCAQNVLDDGYLLCSSDCCIRLGTQLPRMQGTCSALHLHLWP